MSLVMNPNSEASKLLNFSERLDINLLDKVVGYMYTGQKNEQMEAQTVLTTLKEHPDAWTRVDAILEYSQNPQTKYFALQILENVIKTRWKALPRDQCEGKHSLELQHVYFAFSTWLLALSCLDHVVQRHP